MMPDTTRQNSSLTSLDDYVSFTLKVQNGVKNFPGSWGKER